MRFHHTGIRVNDVNTALEWYVDALQCTVERRFQLEDAALDIAMLLTRDGSRIELLGPVHDTSASDNRAGEMHICFEVASVDQAESKLRSLGATITQTPKDIPAAGVRNLWVEDVEGNLLEYIETLDE